MWLALGIAVAGYCVGYGLGEIGHAISEGFKLLAETSKELD